MKYKCKNDGFTLDFDQNPKGNWKYACPVCDCCHGWEKIEND